MNCTTLGPQIEKCFSPFKHYFMAKKTLFDELDQAPKELLTVPQLPNEHVDKNIKWFNQRLKDIEKLKSQKEALLAELAAIKKQVEEASRPASQQLIATYKALVEQALKRMDSKSLALKYKLALNDLISEYCNELEFKYAQDMKAQRSAAMTKLPEKEKKAMKALFSEITGVDQSFDVEDFFNLSEADLKEKYGEEIWEQLKNSADNFFGSGTTEQTYVFDNEEPKKKSKKQLEREAAQEELEKLTKKDFSSLYKALSKRVHPDLEQDPVKKMEREELMKRLIASKDSGDLFALLSIEFALNQSENKGTSILDVETIKRFNNILLEQREKLKGDIFIIQRYNPETAHFYQNFYNPTKKKIQKNIDDYVQSLYLESIEVEEFIEDLQTIAGTKEFLDYREAQATGALFERFFDDFDFDESDDDDENDDLDDDSDLPF
jgi:hypothetical protein